MVLGKKHTAIVLGKRDLIDKINEKATFFFTDATFAVTPGHMEELQVRSSQVLSILADYHGTAVPVFTVVMSCRKVKLYESLMRFLKMEFPQFTPQEFMADWEAGLRRAIINIFPDTRLLGCR